MKNLPVPVLSNIKFLSNFFFIFWCSYKLIFYLYDQVSETEIEEMFDVADTDGDGIIGYPEFMVSRVLDSLSLRLKGWKESLIII